MPVLYEYHDGVLARVKMYTNTWYEMKDIIDRRYRHRKRTPVPGVDRITMGWGDAPNILKLKRRSTISQKGVQHG